MRKCNLFFVPLAMLFATVAHAGFVVTTTRVPITTGTFAGDTGVTLFIRNDGVGTTDPTFGADIIFYDTTISAPASVASPKFFIRTATPLNSTTLIRSPNPSANTQADFGYQGFVPGDADRNGSVDIFDLNALLPNFNTTGTTWSTGDFNGDGKTDIFDLNALLPNFNTTVTPGSYVRFGSPAQFSSFFLLSTTPSETSQTYTDGQSVTGFDVQALVLNAAQAGLPDSVATQLAYAVVPAGQPVTFSGEAQAHAGNAVTYSITDGGAGLSPAAAPVPEPASIGLVACCTLLLCRSRRAASHKS